MIKSQEPYILLKNASCDTPYAMRFTLLRGGVHLLQGLHVHVWCTCSPFAYLGNGWTDCAEIWYVAKDQLVQLHIFLCLLTSEASSSVVYQTNLSMNGPWPRF